MGNKTKLESAVKSNQKEQRKNFTRFFLCLCIALWCDALPIN